MHTVQHLNRLRLDQWGILDVLLTGSSPIDLGRLAIADPEDAYSFVLSYGYDLSDPQQAAEVDRIKAEAIHFIEKYFINPPEYQQDKLKIPDAIRKALVVELLLFASNPKSTQLQRWACAMLRVMHTIAHVANDLSTNFFLSIQEQILNPYYRHIQVQEDGMIVLGQDPTFQIPLVEFQVKAGKDRDSAIMKLLHKAENVAADIFDRLGVRFVTRDKLDALLVMKYLREKNLVTFPNVKPSRSVNTLINVNTFKQTFNKLYRKFDRAEIDSDDFEQTLRQHAQYQDVFSDRQINHILNRNPHTNQEYQSIQFTVRQLVSIPNPLYAYREKIDTDKLQVNDVRMLSNLRPSFRFFFPYEIQLVDAETHRKNSYGDASHELYKQKQIVAARQRILNGLLKEQKKS